MDNLWKAFSPKSPNKRLQYEELMTEIEIQSYAYLKIYPGNEMCLSHHMKHGSFLLLYIYIYHTLVTFENITNNLTKPNVKFKKKIRPSIHT